MEEETPDVPVREIKLPNGCTLLIQANSKGPRIIMIMKGMSIGAEVLPENEFLYGSDDWANKEIELYSDALEIDLKAHTDFIKSCLRDDNVFTRAQLNDNEDD